MKAIYRGFVGTTAEWKAANPVLYAGVWGVELCTDGSRRFKVGDGKHAWKDPELKPVGYLDIEGLPEQLMDLSEGFGNLTAALQLTEENLIQRIDAEEQRAQEVEEGFAADIQTLQTKTETLENNLFEKVSELTQEALSESMNEHNSDIDAHEPLQQKIGTKYEKPSAGIPKTDLANSVQNSLNAADSALQNIPDATTSQKGVAILGANNGAARFGQKADVGLGNVDNTSDAAKPISTATQTALNGKYTKPPNGIPITDLTTDIQEIINSVGYAGMQDPTSLPVGSFILAIIEEASFQYQINESVEIKINNLYQKYGIDNIGEQWEYGNPVPGDWRIFGQGLVFLCGYKSEDMFVLARRIA